MLAGLLTLSISLLAAQPAPAAARFVRAIDTDSDKAVAVVSDPRFDDHEPTAVSEKALARALTNSGLFSEDDVRDLAGPIAAELAKMDPREQVRIVAWSEDGARRTYLYVRHHELQIAYYRRDVELDRIHVRLPTEVATASTPVPAATPAASPGEKTELASAEPMTPLTEDQARDKLLELDALKGRGLITSADWKRKRKEVLNRL